MTRGAESMSFDFPECLYGKPRKVTSSWRKILARVVEDGSWESALRDQSVADVRASASDIVWQTTPRISAARQAQPAWWLGVVEDVSPADLNEQDHAAVLRYQSLLQKGFQYLWFTLGRLRGGAFPVLIGAPESTFEDNQCPFGKRAISLIAADSFGSMAQNVSSMPSPYRSAASSRSQSMKSWS